MIKIIDYKAGNAQSVLHAVAHLGYKADFARTPGDIVDATHIILPGVGSAGATMESLRAMDLIGGLETAVLQKKILFMGICVGMQILFEHSEEDNTDCLGWFKGLVVRFDASKARVPQMGWNRACFNERTGFAARDDYFYFVNSYYAISANEADIWGRSDYNGLFTAAVCRNNICAVQFHVEKSGEAGLALLNDFLRLQHSGEL